MVFYYLLEGVGFVNRYTLKELLNDPYHSFTGFTRYKDGYIGAFGYVKLRNEFHRIDVGPFRLTKRIEQILDNQKQFK